MKPDPSPACAKLADTYGIEERLLCEVQAAGYDTLKDAGIRAVQDTAAPHAIPEDAYYGGRPFGYAATVDPDTGNATCWHVTDDPGRVYATLAGCKPIAQGRDAGKFGDLGAGLYCSDVPQIWIGRSRRKWDFLGELTPPQKDGLYAALRRDVDRQRALNHVTAGEYERGIRDLDYWRDGTYGPTSVVALAGPPYGIAFWKPDYLEPLGIAPGRQPDVVPMQVRGRFAELTGSVRSMAVYDALRRAGLDGAFARDPISSTPQLVVWNDQAVREFDGLRPDCPGHPGPPAAL